MQVDIYSRPWTYDRDEITSRHLKSVNGHLTIIFLADDNGYILVVALLLIGYYRPMAVSDVVVVVVVVGILAIDRPSLFYCCDCVTCKL